MIQDDQHFEVYRPHPPPLYQLAFDPLLHLALCRTPESQPMTRPPEFQAGVSRAVEASWLNAGKGRRLRLPAGSSTTMPSMPSTTITTPGAPTVSAMMPTTCAPSSYPALFQLAHTTMLSKLRFPAYSSRGCRSSRYRRRTLHVPLADRFVG